MLLLSLALMQPATAFAKDYISDGARMFGSNAVKKITLIDSELEQKTGTFVGVVTVKKANEALDLAASRAAMARRANVAMIYIESDSHRFAIAYGMTAQALFSPAMEDSIERSLSDAFRASRYDAGIVGAVSSIAQVIAGGRSGGHGPLLASTTPPPPPRDSGFGWVAWVGILIVGTLLMFVVLRRR